MLAAASRATSFLGDAARATAHFLRSQQNPDGGFRGRSAASDLYYTVFAIEGLIALGEPPDPAPLRRYLDSFGDGAGLDLIHLACLVRCWADIECAMRNLPQVPNLREVCLQRIKAHRSADGGYNPTPGADHGTAYACFFALGALQDLNLPQVPNLREVMGCLSALRREGGGYANERPLRSPTTPTTAAAASVIKQLGGAVDKATAQWLLNRIAPKGGFFATEATPLPDLLSTATALHALDSLAQPCPELSEGPRRATAEFVSALQAESGGFRGLELDEEPDAEYTFYALLALGHLIPVR